MEHVRKGEKIKAGLINQLIDAVQPGTDNSFDVSNGKWPTPFIIQAQSVYDTSTSSNVLSSITLYNNFAQLDGEVYETNTKKWNRDDIDGISSIYAGFAGGTLCVFSNVELEDIEDDLSSKWRLYDISADTSADSFIIKRDYRSSAPASGPAAGGTPYGAFQFELKNEGGLEILEFKNCVFQFGRKTYKIGASATFDVVPFTAGTYYLNIPHSNPANAMVIPIDVGNTLTQSSIPIVELDENGEVLLDYRAMPVIPVWEATPAGG